MSHPAHPRSSPAFEMSAAGIIASGSTESFWLALLGDANHDRYANVRRVHDELLQSGERLMAQELVNEAGRRWLADISAPMADLILTHADLEVIVPELQAELTSDEYFEDAERALMIDNYCNLAVRALVQRHDKGLKLLARFGPVMEEMCTAVSQFKTADCPYGTAFYAAALEFGVITPRSLARRIAFDYERSTTEITQDLMLLDEACDSAQRLEMLSELEILLPLDKVEDTRERALGNMDSIVRAVDGIQAYRSTMAARKAVEQAPVAEMAFRAP